MRKTLQFSIFIGSVIVKWFYGQNFCDLQLEVGTGEVGGDRNYGHKYVM